MKKNNESEVSTVKLPDVKWGQALDSAFRHAAITTNWRLFVESFYLSVLHLQKRECFLSPDLGGDGDNT